MNIQPRDTNNTSSFLKDASIFVLVLTGLTYFLAFNYKKGFLDYYGIDRLLLDNIGVYYINISFKKIILYMAFIVSVYLIDLPNIIKGKKRSDSAIVAVLLGTCLMMLYSVTLASNNSNSSIPFLIKIGIPLTFLVYFFILNSLFKNKPKLFLANFYKKNINPLTTKLKLWVDIIKQSKHLTFITSIIILMIISWIFWLMGNTDAHSKDSYLVINNKSHPLVVIDQNGDKLLVAPINVKKGLISPKFMIIDSKSTIEKPLEFEKYNFMGGLEVEEYKKLEPLNANNFFIKQMEMIFRSLFQTLIP